MAAPGRERGGTWACVRVPAMRCVPQVLGIIGALDPHTHKTNQASLSGEGRLEKEGVRPLRHGAGAHGPAAGGGGGEGGDAGARPYRLLPQPRLCCSQRQPPRAYVNSMGVC